MFPCRAQKGWHGLFQQAQTPLRDGFTGPDILCFSHVHSIAVYEHMGTVLS